LPTAVRNIGIDGGLGEEALGEAEAARVAGVLRHPVLLGCLRELSVEDRGGFLRGEVGAWRSLVEKYVGWFARKVKRRRGCSMETVRSVLRAAGEATLAETTTATYQLEGHWIDPGRRDTGESRLLVEAIFVDAVTAGLVDAGGARFAMPASAPVTWKWHERFVQEHVARFV
jgi:hypothetical protein